MMYKRKIWFLILIIFIFKPICFSVDAKVFTKKTLIIYDKRNYFGYKNDEITSLEELMGHFSTTVDELLVDNYKKNIINSYDIIFYIHLSDNLTNNNLIEDIKNTKKKVCILGSNFENIINKININGISYVEKSFDIVDVKYRQKRFNLQGKNSFEIIDVKNNSAKIYSYISDGKTESPYIFNYKNIWVVSRFDSQGVLFYVFADILHDITGEYHTPSKKVFIRIEDVHPLRDANKLKEIGDYLYSKNIPYMIALIPAYHDMQTNREYKISQYKDFKSVIRYMQDRGASVILHGYSHQVNKDITGEGYEFWDIEKDKPLNVNIDEWVDKRIELGLTECINNKIYPLGFEAPHYASSSKVYIRLKKYFSTYIGQIQTSDTGFTTTIYPYELKNTKFFNMFIPENMGYVDENSSYTISNIMDSLNEVSIVRDYTAGVYYHPYLDIKYLKEIVENLEKTDVEILNLKSMDNWVKYKDYLIYSKNGKIIANINNTENKNINSFNKIFSVTTNTLIVVIAFTCIIFLTILIYSRYKNIRKLFKEKLK